MVRESTETRDRKKCDCPEGIEDRVLADKSKFPSHALHGRMQTAQTSRKDTPHQLPGNRLL
jgi:hypothetical protein